MRNKFDKRYFIWYNISSENGKGDSPAKTIAYPNFENSIRDNREQAAPPLPFLMFYISAAFGDTRLQTDLCYIL